MSVVSPSVSDRDIAIIGVSCRFPGHANDLTSFWSNLVNEVDCVSNTPSDRWNAAYYVDSSKDAPGKINTTRCGFIDNVYEFDYEAFGINKKEAENMDPQQKVLLECTLQTLEDGRIEYRGTSTGVFVGIGQQEQLELTTSDLEYINAYSVTGSALSIASNRISYVFDLRGPSISIDTACSSAMTALHMAVQSIRRNECSQAIVAGVNLLMSPSVMIQFSKLGVMSNDGRCKSFTDAADGYVRSEGCAVILIKPLTAAIRDHHHIYAIIKGTSINADGHRSPSLTLPSGSAQEECFRASCLDARISPRQIFYAEAHATGTKVGDPVEANSIGSVFGEGRISTATDLEHRSIVPTEDEILRIGGVKTHVGHLECASYMAGLLKCLLMLHYETLVPNLYTGKEWSLNPSIEFDKYHMMVQSKHERFDAHMKLMMISSFGFGGANGCSIIQGYKPHRPAISNINMNGIGMNGIYSNRMNGMMNGHSMNDHRTTDIPQAPYLFVLSATTPAALETRIKLAQSSSSSSSSSYNQYAVSYTLATRPLHRHVSFAIGSSIHGALFSPIKKSADTTVPLPIVWCFAGQGPQHPEMGRTLYQIYPIFRSAIDEMDDIYQRVSGESLVHDVGLFGSFKGDPGAVYTLRYTLPSLVFLQTALCDLWRSFGFTPSAVFGHSFGEMAAAYAAGVCSKKQIIETAYHRAHLLAKIDGNGIMIAVGCSPEHIRPWLEEHPDQVWIAAYNGPNSITIGGTQKAITHIADHCHQANLFHRILKITNAYHTPLMRPCKEEALATFATTLAGTTIPAIPYFSTVHPGWKLSHFDASYTWDGIEGAVHFSAAVNACLQRFGSDCIFQEMSAHPVLGSYLTECGAKNVTVTLHRQQHEQESTYKALMYLKIQGQPVNFSTLLLYIEPIPFYLPYVFQHQYCHREDRDHINKRIVPNFRYLAGREISNITNTYQQKVNSRSHPWVCDHVVQGPIVFPAAGYLEMCMEVLTTTGIEDVTIGRAMIVPNDSNTYRTMRTVIEEDQKTVKIYSKMDQWDPHPWTLHVSARNLNQPLSSSPPSLPSWCSELSNRCIVEYQQKQIYDRFRSVGLQYGPLFQGVISMKTGDQEAMAIIDTSLIHEHSTQFIIHPALLDSIFHVLLGSIRYLYLPYVPTRIKRLQWFQSAKDMTSKLRAFARSHLVDDILEGDIIIVEEDNDTIVGIVDGIQCTPLGTTADKAPTQPSYISRWQLYDVADIFIPSRTSSWSAIPADVLSYEPLLDAACIAYISQMLTANELSTTPFQIATWPIHRQRYWRWCQQMVANTNIDTKAIHSIHTILSSSPDHPFYKEVEAIIRAGSNLLTLLSDPYAVQRVLFSDTLMSDIYSLSLTFKPYVRMMSEMIVSFIASQPNRVIHILEIGAGTGALTNDIFTLLQQSINDLQWKGRIKYYYTDVSNKFLHDARARFNAFPFIDYKLYNLDEDPVKQNIPPHSIDLVLAFDVLHVSSSLSQSLNHIQTMLVPHGLLMCIELTRPWIWTEMFFGLFQGWWGFTDERTTCWMKQQQWKQTLTLAGYQDIHIMSDREEQEEIGETQRTETETDREGDRQDREFCHSIITCHAPPLLQLTVNPTSTISLSYPVKRNSYTFDASDPGHDIYHLLSQSQQLIEMKTPADFYLLTVDSQNIAAYNNESLVPDHAPLIGFTRVLSNEAPQHRIVMIDFASQQTELSRKEWHLIIKSLIENTQTHEREFAVRNGVLYVPRFLPFKAKDRSPLSSDLFNIDGQQLPPFRLMIDTVGQLSSLRYHLVPTPTPTPTSSASNVPILAHSSDDVVVSVYASALNFKDLMLALGMLNNPMGLDRQSLRFDPPTTLGIEFSGVIIAVGSNVTGLRIGQEVFGIGKHCLANQIVTSQHFVALKPSHISHIEAASMPIVFTTAYAGLMDKARIQTGETVLIHSAAGGIGQASIQLCQYVGADIIATVGNNSKRLYLQQRYGIQKFADSHSADDWHNTVQLLTNNDGVDTVINSLKGEAIIHGLECLKIGGRFVEIGKVDILANNPLPMKLLLKDISFLSVQLDVLMASNNSDKLHQYLTRISQLTERRSLSPLVDRVFSCADIELAFRYLMAGQHMGKIVIDFSPTAQQNLISRTTTLAASTASLLYPPSSPFSPFHTNIFSGGCGAVALKLLYYMAVRGARYFVLLSRRGPSALRQSERQQLESLDKYGVKIQIAQADVNNIDSISDAYINAIHHGFPRTVAIFHLAMVLYDDPISRLSEDRLTPVLDCKMLGIKNLVAAFNQSDVSYIVMFSSAASVLGNPSQSNYAAANAFLDAYAFYLSSRGYISKVVNLGSVEDVGVLAEDYRLRQLLTAKGFAGGLTSTGAAQITQQVIQDIPYLSYTPTIIQSPSQQYLHGAFDWAAIVNTYPILSTRFAHLVDHTILDTSQTQLDQPSLSLPSLISVIAAILDKPMNKLDDKESLTRQGLDSLLAVELSATLKKKFGGLTISQMELLGGMSVQNIWEVAQGPANG